MLELDSSSKCEDGSNNNQTGRDQFQNKEEVQTLHQNQKKNVEKSNVMSNQIPLEICVDDDVSGKKNTSISSISKSKEMLEKKQNNEEEKTIVRKNPNMPKNRAVEGTKQDVEILECDKKKTPPHTSCNLDITERKEKNEKEEKNDEDFNQKAQDILSCLNGYNDDNNDDVVDLWKLRELALSRGGFISSTLRKGAWPKLVGIRPATNNVDYQHPPSAVVTKEDAELIQNDIKRSVWDIYFHWKQNRRKNRCKQEIDNQQITRPKSSLIPESTSYTDLLSFTSDTTFTSNDGTLTSVTSTNTTQTDIDTPTLTDVTTSNISSTIKESNNNIDETIACSHKSSKKRRKNRSPKNVEKSQQILSTIITSVLECKINDDMHNKNQKNATPTWEQLFYYQGFHDVTALCLINLESPSLTTLLLQRLSQQHFRDAMRPNFDSLSHLLSRVFKPLLHIVDPELHDYIFLDSYVGPDCMFALSWILSWFSHDIVDSQVASRLIDVFLASHMSMPIYISAALLSHQRDIIFQTESDFAAIHVALTNLPRKKDRKSGELMEMMEEIIELAISYMKQFPPKVLVKRFIQKLDDKSWRLSTKNDNDKIIRLAMLEESPDWCTANTAPTDWALIQASNNLRRNNIDSLTSMAKQEIEPINKTYETDYFISHYKEYEIALTAAGLSYDIKETRVGRKRKQKKQIVRLVMFASGLAIAVALSKYYSLIEPTSLREKLSHFGILFNEDFDGEKETKLILITETQGTNNGDDVIDNDTSLYHRYHKKDKKKNKKQSPVKREERINIPNVKRHDKGSDKLAMRPEKNVPAKLLDEDKEVHPILDTIVQSVGDNNRGQKQKPRRKIIRHFYHFIQESLRNDAEIVLL